MRLSLLPVVSLIIQQVYAGPISNATAAATSDLPRLVVYFQTTHDNGGTPVSMLPLIHEKNIALTHLIVCSFHINQGSKIRLNDFPPDNPRFYTLWNETAYIKSAGVKVMGMIGGAAAGSFDASTLDGDAVTFEKYYGQLQDAIAQFKLDGMDLDVEQSMSQSGISRLINRLRKDFGADFIITLAPVASSLKNGANLSGFDYKALETGGGDDIAFYNAQFYSGFGAMAQPDDYVEAVSNGFSASKLVAGQLTLPSNGFGYIPYEKLNATVISLRDKFGQIGGVMGWEYYNSALDSTAEPWKWAQVMTEILRPNAVPTLKITSDDARRLSKAFDDTVRMSFSSADRPAVHKVDYFAMVNAS